MSIFEGCREVKISYNLCDTGEQRVLQNHLGLTEVRGEMWGFYPHYAHRDRGMCSKLFLSIKYSHRGEMPCMRWILNTLYCASIKVHFVL